MKFGLIGYPLKHSFSAGFFTEKFHREGWDHFSYQNFPIENIRLVPELLAGDCFGFNVTIPYKETIIPYLDELDETAGAIGAVNTLVRTDKNTWKGFNTDAMGFETAFREWMGDELVHQDRALVLGAGGASKAVVYVLRKLGITPVRISRTDRGDLAYTDLSPEVVSSAHLIINTTPLGMAPNEETAPAIPYDWLSPDHWLFDLVYNPANTVFLARGAAAGAHVSNGLEMLYLQALHAWAIWKSYGKF